MDTMGMKNGGFGWFELMTTDVNGAKDFYKKLFGWEYEEVPASEPPYTVVKMDGRPVAGIMGMPEGCGQIRPCWDIYVTVEDVDKTVKQVTESGGKILRPAFDIPDVGRFCVLEDPQGAAIMAITYVKK
ncbi:glyoxalase [Candidatus Fermentibacteria bacterium]|nr:MAG: glyoxalase [Candidatus Fermentibacteria bacterium]